MKDCSGHGTCDHTAGQCQCVAPFTGPACETITCPADCSGNGACDQLTGLCTCDPGFVGKSCLASTTCEAVEMDWWTSMDTEGWSTCPRNTYITALYHRDCTALACVEMAKCEKACAGGTPRLPNDAPEICYHAAWHDAMDQQGWARCAHGFFLAGLYRSKCDSLYCLELAKCCSIKGGSWGSCQETDWAGTFQTEGWSTAPSDHFLTGLYRSKEDNLNGIQHISACTHADHDSYLSGDSRARGAG